MLRPRGIFRGIPALVAAACIAAVPAALPLGAFASTGVATFSGTGANQLFTVPAAVTGIVAELFGARGGAGFVSPFTGPISSPPWVVLVAGVLIVTVLGLGDRRPN